MGPGFFIVLEGVDGAGKTTQARLLAEALEKRGDQVVLTREPSDGPTGKKILEYLMGPVRSLTAAQELALFMADRREHVNAVIRPALEHGMVVISDRYYYSSAAYQGALGLDPARIVAKHEPFAPPPNLVIIFHLSPAAALARRRGKARQVSESPDYLEKVAAVYATFQGPGLYHVNAAATAAAVHARVLEITLKALENRTRSKIRRYTT
jgi:dTMP kinase